MIFFFWNDRRMKLKSAGYKQRAKCDEVRVSFAAWNTFLVIITPTLQVIWLDFFFLFRQNQVMKTHHFIVAVKLCKDIKIKKKKSIILAAGIMSEW